MGLGQEANNLKKEIDKDIRSSGWGGLVFYSLFLIFIIGCVIYALGSWTETPAVPKDSTGSSVTDRSEQEQQQQNKQKKKVTKVKISKNYYIILPETADLKSKTKKDNVTEKHITFSERKTRAHCFVSYLKRMTVNSRRTCGADTKTARVNCHM